MKRVIVLLVAGTLVSAVGAVWASSQAASKVETTPPATER